MTANASSKPPVTISLATEADIPDLAACELLAFSREDDRIASLLFPLRSALAKSGTHPRHWPDFSSTVRRRQRTLLSESFTFKAVVHEVDHLGEPVGEGIIAGMAILVPPKHVRIQMKNRRRWRDRFLVDYVYPAVDSARKLLWTDLDGMDADFFNVLKSGLEKSRKEIGSGGLNLLSVDDSFLLDILLVHPHYQRRGIGLALLQHCVAIAASNGIPLFLESSQAGYALYKSVGFVDVHVCPLEYKGETIINPMMVKESESSSSFSGTANDVDLGHPMVDGI